MLIGGQRGIRRTGTAGSGLRAGKGAREPRLPPGRPGRARCQQGALVAGPVRPSGLRHGESSPHPREYPWSTPRHQRALTQAQVTRPWVGCRCHLEPPVMALDGWDPLLTPGTRDGTRTGSPEPLREVAQRREEGKSCRAWIVPTAPAGSDISSPNQQSTELPGSELGTEFPYKPHPPSPSSHLEAQIAAGSRAQTQKRLSLLLCGALT